MLMRLARTASLNDNCFMPGPPNHSGHRSVEGDRRARSFRHKMMTWARFCLPLTAWRK